MKSASAWTKSGVVIRRVRTREQICVRRASFSDLKIVPKMAINAGYWDIRVYVRSNNDRQHGPKLRWFHAQMDTTRFCTVPFSGFLRSTRQFDAPPKGLPALRSAD